MATQERFPTGDSADPGRNELSASSGSDKYEMVNEDPHNGDADYIFRLDSAGQQGFTFIAFSLGAASSINSVTVHAAAREALGGTGLRLGLVVSGTLYLAAEVLLTEAYVDYSATWTTNPATGSAWTKSAVENDIQEMVVRFTSMAAGEESRATQVKMSVDYNPMYAGRDFLLLKAG
jgi:hypothetical protein